MEFSMVTLSFNSFHAKNCEFFLRENKVFISTADEGFIYINCINYNEIFRKGYLSVDAVNHEKFMEGVGFCFWEQGNETNEPDLIAVMGLIPGLKTRLALPLDVLNGQTLYLKRTPGKLKSVVVGHGINPQKISRFAIGLQKRHIRQTVELSNLFVSSTEPDYPLLAIPMVDEFGQLIARSYKGMISTEKELKRAVNEEMALPELRFREYEENTLHKGRKKLGGTGFYRVEKTEGKFTLVDPDGFPFVSLGMDCVNPDEYCPINQIRSLFKWLPKEDSALAKAYQGGGSGPKESFSFIKSNLLRAFGTQWYEKWRELTRNRLLTWGFNTIGAWSSDDFCQWSGLPYVKWLNDFPTTSQNIFRDFPDVFNPEYAENSRKFALQLDTVRDERNVLGYFLRNEPQWAFVKGLVIAKELIRNQEDLYSKREFFRFLLQKYETIEKLNQAWESSFEKYSDFNEIAPDFHFNPKAEKDLKEFSKALISRYLSLPSKECRKVDRNHLNLGIRYAFISDPMILSGSKCFDVFSFNCYKFDPCEDIKMIGEKTGLPVLIGEFHFGAIDGAPFATGLCAVGTQKERGIAYRYYIENAAQSPYFVGAHYFSLNDEEILGRGDGESYQIGFINVCNLSYKKFADYVSVANKNVYAIKSGVLNPTKEKATALSMIGF